MCKRLARQLAGLVDRTLEEEELRRLEAHAAQCPRCGPLLERSRRIACLLEDLPQGRAPDGVLDGVWERILREEEPRLGPLLSQGLPSVSLSGQAAHFDPLVEDDSRLAEVFASLPSREAPPEVDRAVFGALRRFLWGRSREARILRKVTASLAAAASLLLCFGLWWGIPRESAIPRKVAFLIQDESVPPSLWPTPEALQVQIHGGLPGWAPSRKEGRSKGR